jgi:hypothetical protein
MIRNSDQAVAAIDAHGLPAALHSIATGDIPSFLAGICCVPERFFKIADELGIYFPLATSLVPLWEENREVLVAYDPISGHYLEHFYGSPPDNTKILGRTYQAFLTVYLAQLLEAGFRGQLPELAAFFGYAHAEHLLAVASNASDDAWYEAITQLAESLE